MLTKVQHDTLTLVDTYPFEIVVAYTKERIPTETEDCHGPQIIEGGWEIELVSVEVAVNGGGSSELIHTLNKKQRDLIIEQIEDAL